MSNRKTVRNYRNLFVGAGFVALLVGLAAGQAVLKKPVVVATAEAAAEGTPTAPRFEVDPLWPKPLPNHWVIGSTIGVWADADDHIWIVHRGAMTLDPKEKFLDTKKSECCATAPQVLEFDQAGNLLRHWGGPGQGYDWPESLHGITIDYKGNVWLAGNGPGDSHLLKFTKDGKFLMQIGKPNARRKAGAAAGGNEGDVKGFAGGSTDPVSFGRAARVFVDPKANEAYVADGYLNKRVAVIDADTGKIKRFWGAYGNKPDDTILPAYDPSQPLAQQFRQPVHCAEMSVDRFVYVCDRGNNRVQVFTPAGKFVKEMVVSKEAVTGIGTVFEVAFSKDPEQKYLYIADGANEKVRILDRQSLKELTNFGDGGRQPGQFYMVHSIATDSKGNIYTTETFEGKRLQRFVFKGVGPVTKMTQGTEGVLPASK